MRTVIHTSDRTSFKRCRQRWEFSSPLRMNLEPKAVITPLWFGQLMHTALAVYYDPDTPRSATDAIAQFEWECKGWLAQFSDPDPERVTWLDEQLSLGVGMLEYYFSWAAKNDNFTVVWVEKNFEVPIPGLPGVSYSFKCDGLVQDEDLRFWILEHKTTQQFPTSDDYLLNDDQCGSYLWALAQLDNPIIAEGVIYNSLKKKAPHHLKALKRGGFSINKMQDIPFEWALKELRDHYGRIPKHYYPFLRHLRDQEDKFVRRDQVRRNRKELDLIGNFMRYEVIDMINNPTIYRTPSRINCNGCPFFAPCLSKWESSDYEYMLSTMYRKRTLEW